MILNTIRNVFKIGELRKRILFTLTILGIERIGTLVVTPGIDTAVLEEGFKQLQGTLFGLYDLFAGGAFSRAAVFGLGIMYVFSKIWALIPDQLAETSLTTMEMEGKIALTLLFVIVVGCAKLFASGNKS